ncbi:MAG: Ldh family oxidoreductase [bacterium]
MRYVSAERLQKIGMKIFDAAGSPHDESDLVSDMLVRSNLAGHDSHGVMRISQYVKQIRSGELRPGATVEVQRETRSTAVIQGHQGWGPVVARKAMRLAMDKAHQHSVGMVTVRGSQHVGRLGEYPRMAAEEKMISLALVNSHGVGEETVVPWGGLDRRFTPNPMAFAAPTGEEWPILVDFSASVIPEGKVRDAFYKGEHLREGCIIDHEGNPTTDPADFYGSPPGALLPLGGIVGHKGYGLLIVTELLGGALSAAGCAGQRVMTTGNGAFFQAIDIDDFLPVEEFIETVQELISWVKSSRKKEGVSEILLPGEPEYRTAQERRETGIPLPDSVWEEILNLAADLDVELPT